MGKVKTWIIDPKRLFREGLKNVLADGAFDVVGECNEPAEVAREDVPIDLVLFDIPSEPVEIAPFVGALTQRFHRARFVVLTNVKCQDCASTAVDAGAHGYILKDITPDMLFEALDLVLDGVVVLPTPADLGVDVAEMAPVVPLYEELEPEMRVAVDRSNPEKDNRDVAMNLCRDMGHNDAVRMCKRNRWYDLLAAIQANRNDALALPAG